MPDWKTSKLYSNTKGMCLEVLIKWTVRVSESKVNYWCCLRVSEWKYITDVFYEWVNVKSTRIKVPPKSKSKSIKINDWHSKKVVLNIHSSGEQCK